MAAHGRKVAVVLSGGGAKGAYEIGALKALKAHGIEPDILSGTSVGSFNAAMLGAGKPLDEIEQLWSKLETRDVFTARFDPRDLISLDPLVPLRVAWQGARSLGSFLTDTLRNGGRWWEALDLDEFLLDTSPLAELIARNVDLRALHSSEKKVIVALTRLRPSQADPLALARGAEITHQHILASCSLPFIFNPVSIGEQTFCDGGVVMNSPLKPVIEAGAEEIYVIDLTPPPRMFEDFTLALAYQILSIQFSVALRRDIEFAHDRNAQFLASFMRGGLREGKLHVERAIAGPGAEPEMKSSRYRYLHVTVIRPESDLGGLGGFLNFDPKAAKKFIADGERDTERALGCYEDRHMVAPDGSHLAIRCHRAARTA